MNTDDKILKALEDLKEGQKALQTEVEKVPGIEKQLEQQGKLLNGIATTMATVLEEQQAQRMDIRSLHADMQSLHSEVHASKEELKAEIRVTRADAKRDIIDLKATVLKKSQSYERRITNLEEHDGIENPDKN